MVSTKTLLLKHYCRRQGNKRHININFFVRLVLGRPRVSPGDFTGFVPGTNPGFILILHSGSPISPGLSLGQTRFVPGTIPGTKGGTESLCEKKFMCLFRSLAQESAEKGLRVPSPILPLHRRGVRHPVQTGTFRGTFRGTSLARASALL